MGKDIHVMVDLETLGTSKDSTVIQIAAKAFSLGSKEGFSELEVGDTFNKTIDVSKMPELSVEGSTLAWWLSDKAELLRKLTVSNSDLSENSLFTLFDIWLTELGAHGDLFLWGNGIAFDNVIIAHKFEQYGRKYPIHFRNERDVRTIVALAASKTGVTDSEYKKSLWDGTQAHDAINDVNNQITLVKEAYNCLVGKAVHAETSTEDADSASKSFVYDGEEYRLLDRDPEGDDYVVFTSLIGVCRGTRENVPYELFDEDIYFDDDRELLDVYGWVDSEDHVEFYEKVAKYDEDIEFNGFKYRKVVRDADKGDVVVFTHIESGFDHGGTQLNKCYEILSNYGEYINEDGVNKLVCGWGEGTEWIVYEEVKEKSANEQRAEIIEKAKRCVIAWLKPNPFIDEWNYRGAIKGFTGRHPSACGIPYLSVDEKKRTVHFVARGASDNKLLIKTKATCHPNDVFNEHIGEAIALGRALGRDVSEFENAIQPTVAVGQVVEVLDLYNDSASGWRGVVTDIDFRGYPKFNDGTYATNYKITDDTNAQYGGDAL